MSKNIETCKSEEVLSSVLDQQPQDYPSVQQAVHDLGVTALPAASAADPDIAELPANVEVFVRRVLKAVVYDRVLPVVQQMWQAVWPRFADYLPDTLRPYASNPSLRTLGTLPTALSALSSRKISTGGATGDGIKDGESLGRLLAADYSLVTKIHDDTHGWTMDKNLFGNFPNLASLHLNCKTMTVQLGSIATLSSLEMPELELFDVYQGGMLSGQYQGTSADFRKLKTTYSGILYDAPYLTVNPFRDLETITPRYGYQSMCILGNTAIDTIELPNLKTVNASGGCGIIQGGTVRVIKCPALYSCTSNYNGHSTYSAGLIAGNLPNLEELEVGTLTGTGYLTPNSSVIPSTPKLKKVVLGQGTNVSVTLNGWTPSAETIADEAFLQNFLHHIAERLAVGPTTNRLTLTLSADVYSACGFGATIDDTTDIRYQIKKAIQDRNWKVTDGTNNFNQ